MGKLSDLKAKQDKQVKVTETPVFDAPTIEDGEIDFPTQGDEFMNASPSVRKAMCDVIEGKEEVRESPIKVNVPDIRTSAVLVSLTITEWTGKKKDAKASREVTSNHGAAAYAAKVNKELLPKFEALKEMHNFVAATRKRHMELTMPWQDSGQRLLTTAAYAEYTAWEKAKRAEFAALRDKVASQYEWEVKKVGAANSELGTLYNPDDYDSKEVIQGKFSIDFRYNPVPSAGDFRVDVGKEALEELQASCDAAYEQTVAAATLDLWKRLHGPLQNMVDNLQEGNFDGTILGFKTKKNGAQGEPKVKGFKETLVPNVLSIVRMMEVANWDNNPVMDEAIRKLKSDLTGVNTGMLKNNTATRQKVRTTAEQVLKSIPSLDI